MVEEVLKNLLPIKACERHYFACKPWFEDREITRWLTSPLRLARYPRLIHDRLVTDRKNRLFFIMDGSCAVGVAGLENIDRIDHKAEVWYLVADPCNRRRNHASNAVASLVQWSCTMLRLVTLYAHVSPLNQPSIKVLEKCGFQYAGRLRRAFFIHDSYQDLLIYDLVTDIHFQGGNH